MQLHICTTLLFGFWLMWFKCNCEQTYGVTPLSIIPIILLPSFSVIFSLSAILYLLLLIRLPSIFHHSWHFSPTLSFFSPLLHSFSESRENSFSRSRSSSVSSIDRETKEAVTTLQFAESYGRKSDTLPTPCLWVGTSLGLVLIIPMSIPTDEQERQEDPVTVAPTGISWFLSFSNSWMPLNAIILSSCFCSLSGFSSQAQC